MFSTVHTAYHNYWYATNLSSVYETGTVPPVVTFAETVKNALYIWWSTAGSQQIANAESQFITWFLSQPTMLEAVAYSQEWIMTVESDPQFQQLLEQMCANVA